MPFADMREFISLLEKRGELLRIPQEVDWDLEIGAWLHTAIRTQKQPGLVFENIKGYPKGYTAAGMLVPNVARWALALDFPEDVSWSKMIAGIDERCRKPIPPVLVRSGPCQEEVQTGDQVNVLKFPVPHYIARDGGRYLGTWHCVITKDPETGVRNVGMYRVMVHDRDSLGIFICPGENAQFHYEKWKALGKPMPVAITLGQDEVLPLNSLWSWPYGVDEFAMAGAMRQAPVELVKCKTVDLEVPATAEIVVEGEVSLNERRPEGPFGEYTGHMGAQIKEGPVIRVSAVTHRRDPVYRAQLNGRPPCEYVCGVAISRAAGIFTASRIYGRPDIIAAYVLPNSPEETIAVSIHKSYAGQAFDVASFVFEHGPAPMVKNVIVCDADIDVSILGEVIWAFNCRVKPSRDIRIIPGCCDSPLDPAIPVEERGLGDRMIIDATWPMEPEDHFPPRPQWNGQRYPLEALPDGETLARVETFWRELKLPG